MEPAEVPPERGVELLDLAALPLPAHPKLFLRIPPPCPMKEEERSRSVGCDRRAVFRFVRRRLRRYRRIGRVPTAAAAVPGVQRFDATRRPFQQRLVVRHLFPGRIPEVGDQGKAEVRIDVAQKPHLEGIEQLVDLLRVREQRGYRDHRALFRWYSFGVVHARQNLRASQKRREPVNRRDRELADAEDNEGGSDAKCPEVDPQMRRRPPEKPAARQRGQQDDRAEVNRQRESPRDPPEHVDGSGRRSQRSL